MCPHCLAFRYFLKIATGAPGSKVGPRKSKPLPVFERPLHILIVEDNEINSRVLSRQLVKASLTFESEFCPSPVRCLVLISIRLFSF